STMVLARLLLDRGELHTRHGRVLVGISLVEDLAAVVLMALMPALGALASDRLLAIARGLGVAALLLVPFFAIAARLVPPLLTRVARTRDQELFLLVALMIGLGTAAVTQAVGLSLALVAFLAGLLTGIGLAQIGEFSFVLVQAARQEGHVGPDIYQATLAASLLSILINAALVRTVPRYLGALQAAGRPGAEPAAASRELEGHVIVC